MRDEELASEEVTAVREAKPKFFRTSRLVFWGVSLLVIAFLILVSSPIVIR